MKSSILRGYEIMIKSFLKRFEKSFKYLVTGLVFNLVIPVWNDYLYGLHTKSYHNYLYIIPIVMYVVAILKFIEKDTEK